MIMVLGGLAASGACAKDPDVAKRESVRRGDEYVAHGKYHEAIIEYRNALQSDPMFADAQLKLAQAYERLGDTGHALREFVRAGDLLPSNADVQLKAANYLLATRQFEDAKARAEKVLAAAPDNAAARITLGSALAGLNDLDAAVAEIQDAIRENSGQSVSYRTLGAVELARGRRREAEEAFTNATLSDPKSARARLALANFYWSIGDLAAAERELKTALTIDARDGSANRALAVLLVVTNRARDAERYLKAVADISGQSRDRLVLADYYLSMNRSADARSLLIELTASDAKASIAATIRLSAIAARGGDRAAAHRLLDDVLQKQPGNVDSLVASADLFLDDHQPDQALARADAAVKANPRSAAAYLVLGKSYGAREDWDQALPAYNQALALDGRLNAARVALARVAFIKGRLEDAIRFAQEALSAQPGQPEARLILARATLLQGNVARAQPHVDTLAGQLPKSANGQAELGQLYALKGDSGRARQAFEQALSIDPAHFAALSGLTALDIQAKNPAAARGRVEARLAASPSDPRLLLLAARLYGLTGDGARAEQSLRRTIEVDPARLEAYTLLGQLYASQGRLDEARAEFERIAQQSPKSPWAPTVVGIIFQMQARLPEAQASYEKALTRDPRAAVAANNLAWIYAQHGGNLDTALSLAQTAKSQLPDSPEVGDTLGWVFLKKEMPTLAVRALRESVDRSPKSALHWYHLALAYAKGGNNDEAVKALQQALTLDAKFDGAADARRLLSELRG